MTEARKLKENFDLDTPKACQLLRECLEKGELRAEQFSLRDLAETFIENGREWVASLNPRYSGGGDVQLLEAGGVVNLGAFKNITGQLLYSKIMEEYNLYENVSDQLCQTIPTQFSGEKIPGIGGIGDKAEIVDEGQPYPRAGVAEDWVETPETTRRGMIVEVTKEAVFFDRTNVLLQRCQKVGEWLGINKAKRIIDIALGVTNNYKWKGTAYDTYQATTPWVNVNSSNGLVNWTDIDDALQLFAGITDPHTGEPIIIIPRQILLNGGLAATARYILNATQVVVDPNATAATLQYQTWVPNNVMVPGQYAVIESPIITARYTAGSVTATHWYFGDFRRAFAYMENWPIQVVQRAAGSEPEFERDVVFGIKASERGVCAVLDPRYVQQNTA
jgi:hypothetical protein